LRLAAGADEDFVAPFAAVSANRKLADGEAEKVKTGAAIVFVERVGEVGFGGFQVQSHCGQVLFNQGAGSQQFFQVFAENNKVICKADDDRPIALGEGFCQGCFKIMQGDVGEQGRNDTPLRCACFRRGDCAIFKDTGLQPAAYLAVDKRDTVEFGK